MNNAESVIQQQLLNSVNLTNEERVLTTDKSLFIKKWSIMDIVKKTYSVIKELALFILIAILIYTINISNHKTDLNYGYHLGWQSALNAFPDALRHIDREIITTRQRKNRRIFRSQIISDYNIDVYDNWEKLYDNDNDITKLSNKWLTFNFPIHIPYELVSLYGPRCDPFTGGNSFHSGIDIAPRCGYRIKKVYVYSIGNGIILSKSHTESYGNVVKIQHTNNIISVYAHLSKITIKSKKIKSGDIIGIMGSTGKSTGKHLHFEIRTNDITINPLLYF